VTWRGAEDTAQVLVHHPTAGKGEQMMNAVSVGHPSHPAKPLAACIGRPS